MKSIKFAFKPVKLENLLIRSIENVNLPVQQILILMLSMEHAYNIVHQVTLAKMLPILAIKLALDISLIVKSFMLISQQDNVY